MPYLSHPQDRRPWLGAAALSVGLHAALLFGLAGPAPSLPAPEARPPIRVVLTLASAAPAARAEAEAASSPSEPAGSGKAESSRLSPAPAAARGGLADPGSRARNSEVRKGSAASSAPSEALRALPRRAKPDLPAKAPTLPAVFAAVPAPAGRSGAASEAGASVRPEAAAPGSASWQGSSAVDLSGSAPRASGGPGPAAGSAGAKPGPRVDAQARQRRGDLAFYLRAWQAKVEAEGRRSYPSNPFGGAAEGRLRLRVSVRSDGSVVGAEVVRTSGMDWLDRAAQGIALKAGPYAAFPPELAADYPLLEIEREFAFQES